MQYKTFNHCGKSNCREFLWIAMYLYFPGLILCGWSQEYRRIYGIYFAMQFEIKTSCRRNRPSQSIGENQSTVIVLSMENPIFLWPTLGKSCLQLNSAENSICLWMQSLAKITSNDRPSVIQEPKSRKITHFWEYSILWFTLFPRNLPESSKNNISDL